MPQRFMSDYFYRQMLYQDHPMLTQVQIDTEGRNLSKVVNQQSEFPFVLRQIFHSNIRIETTQNGDIFKIMQLVKNYYVTNNLICKYSNISNDVLSLDAFMNIIRTWILKKESLVAIKEGTKELAGLIVGEVVSKTSSMDVYNFLKPGCCGKFFQGDALYKFLLICAKLHKNFDIFCNYEVESYFCIQAFCVQQKYQKTDLLSELLSSTIDFAKLMNVNVVAGIFAGNEDKVTAKSVGMKVMTTKSLQIEGEVVPVYLMTIVLTPEPESVAI